MLSFNARQMEYLDAVKTHCDRNFKMVMVVLGSKDKQVYDAAKVELCTQRASTCIRLVLFLMSMIE